MTEQDQSLILETCRSLVPFLGGKTVFVTGGTGFIGKNLLETVQILNSKLQAEIQLVLLSRDPESFLRKYPQFADPQFRFVKGDMRDFEFPRERMDFIIHGASEVLRQDHYDDPSEVLIGSLLGQKHLNELAAQKRPEAFLLISTGAAYGPQPRDMDVVPETYMGGPDTTLETSSYAEGKRLAESLACVGGQRGNYPVKVARAFTFAGPWLPLDGPFAVGNFVGDTLRGESVHVTGDGTPLRSYMYSRELIVWLLHILCRGEAFRVYNVGSPVAVSIHELAERISLHGVRPLPISVAQRPTSQLPSRYVPDTTRAQQELGLHMHVDTAESLRRYYAWCDENWAPKEQAAQ